MEALRGSIQLMQTSGNGFCLLGDQPFTAGGDPLGFEELARQLKSVILASRASTPFTIGIEASWGRGKSSLMGRLAEDLQGESSDGVAVETVKFNAWTAEGKDVLEGLVKAVLDAMDPSVLRRALRNERIVGLTRILVQIVASKLGLSSLADDVWNRLSVDAKTRNDINDLVAAAMRSWIAAERDATADPTPQRLLVVFVDDLDRCAPENVLKVFEAIKLYLNAKGIVFVVGYDSTIVSDAVLEKKQYSKQVTGRDYIEKVVQIVCPLPHPTDEEINELLNRYLAESKTTKHFVDAERKLLIDRNARNPRRIKRFVNRFVLAQQLDPNVSLEDADALIKLLILETYFNDFARLLRRAPAEKPTMWNPLGEFLTYVSARSSLQRRSPNDDAARLFELYELGSIDPEPSDALTRLDRAAEEAFVRYAEDRDFLSFVATLSESEQDAILAMAQRRNRLGIDRDITPDEAPPASERPSLVSLQGVRVLWIDDDPETIAAEVEELRKAGVQLRVVENGDAAAQVVKVLRPDVLISDLTRGTDTDAGFKDLERLRTKYEFSGPAIFYVARVSAERRDRATELGARITNDATELMGLVTLAVEESRPVAA